jgi:serine beta-lactamase-like protein LACTB, mitochondrial
MAKNRNRFEAWAAMAVLAVTGLLVAFVALPAYMRVTAAPLHPEPERAPSVAQPDLPPQWSEAVARGRQIARTALAAQNLPGLSVAVGVGGDVVWAEGFGWAELDAHAPVRPQTEFRLGSASKMLTSAAVGVLLEQGRLNLDEEIQTHVPQFPRKQWPVTLRQVMAHVAGIGTERTDDGPLFHQRCQRPVDALHDFAGDPLLFQPGTGYRYSNYGWIPVSAAIESAADQPFLSFMREQIFEPLRMTHTGADSATAENPEHIGEPEEDPPPLTFIHDVILVPLGIADPKPKFTPPNRATFYVPASGADPRGGVRMMRLQNLSCYAGSMAFFSTPSDLVRFGLAMNNGALLQPATVQLLQAPQQLTTGQQTGYGLGWRAENTVLAGAPEHGVGDDGEWRGGRIASVKMFRERGIVVAVMSNVTHADTTAVAQRVAEAFASATLRR